MDRGAAHGDAHARSTAGAGFATREGGRVDWSGSDRSDAETALVEDLSGFLAPFLWLFLVVVFRGVLFQEVKFGFPTFPIFLLRTGSVSCHAGLGTPDVGKNSIKT